MTKQEFKKIKSWLDKLLEEAIKERPLEIDTIKERLYIKAASSSGGTVSNFKLLVAKAPTAFVIID